MKVDGRGGKKGKVTEIPRRMCSMPFSSRLRRQLTRRRTALGGELKFCKNTATRTQVPSEAFQDEAESMTVDELEDEPPVLKTEEFESMEVDSLMSVSQSGNRPPLVKPPLIWSSSRQELCESFDYFRSFQGGVYHSKDIVKGYLLGGFASKRDIFAENGKLIISHGGGKAEATLTSKGKTRQQGPGDQEEGDRSVRALLNTQAQGTPVVLLADHKYSLFPFNMRGFERAKISYAVLGLYFISHAWAEKELVNGRSSIRYKFAFQWCDKEDPWWWTTIEDAMDAGLEKLDDPNLVYPRQAPQPENGSTRFRVPPVKLKMKSLSELRPPKNPTLYHKCPSCSVETPQVFSIGWACLHPDCTAFWKINNESLPEDLQYNPSFLKLLPNSPFEMKFDDIKPPPPLTIPHDGITTVRSFLRGYFCDNCGKLSCRYKWQQWECSSCGRVLKVEGRIREPKEFRGMKIPVKDSVVAPNCGITRLPARLMDEEEPGGPQIEIDEFVLPGGDGRVYHVKTPKIRLKVVDKIFEEYQKQSNSGELIFRRWPLRSHKLEGEMLTQYFSHNCGEPYQYVGGAANTVPWEKAPSAVAKARALIRRRTVQVKRLKDDEFQGFNEILSAAYMQDQKMSFHTDDEPGLGPIVAGLSLGAPALMHFRPRHRNERGKQETVLTVPLRHGDVLIMDGDSLQKNYEHTVAPLDFRIAATARFINPNRNLK